MLQIKNLTLTHKKDLRTLTENFSFVLNPGDKAVLIGEEGNGKSTLLKWIYDPSLIESYCQWSGQLAGDTGLMGYLAQDIQAEEKSASVYEFCSAEPAFHSLTPKELSSIARQLRFPVEEFYDTRPVGTLSGGEQIKLQLGRLLFANPTLLLLDEPSSDLDLETLRWLETFIRDYKGIILYISHDEALIEHTANLILHIEHPREGKPPRSTAHRLDYRTYVERRNAGIASQTQQARKEQEEYDKKMERYRRIQQKVEHDQASISRQDPHGGRLLKKKMHTV
ncbi:MAG: ATP-binding cassette domain-containing protein, partial [Oscillospiraceae bacterium]|nr:ATP-binding cassette domain-containing protein [Oscillospiraceae bacterium]